jgi:hypothetical protein
MAVEQIMQAVYSYLLGWTGVILVILLIAKIIQSLGGMGGGSWFGKKGDDADTPSSGDGKTKKEKKDSNPDDPSGNGTEGLDIKNPGMIKVLVLDTDDNPLQGVTVRVTPARMWKRHWGIFKTKKNWREYRGVTGPDGTWPSRGQYQQIGSGSIRIQASKIDYTIILTAINSGAYEQGTDYEILPKEQYEVVVTMQRKGEKAEWFEPKVLSVVSEGEESLHVTGIIK